MPHSINHAYQTSLKLITNVLKKVSHLCVVVMLLMALQTTDTFAQSLPDTVRSKFLDTLYMGEVVISAKTAMRIHGDTTSYRVDSFNTDPLANTEDVLKRLPGVEVSRDGKVTIQGKPVNKLFINGKEYFADDLSSVLQNMPAEVLEKIQVADYRDEDTEFTGMKDNATEKVINLQFKKKYSGGIYGRGTAGYGTKGRYQGGAFVNYMDGDGMRVTAMSGANNTGISDVTSDNSSAKNNSWSSPGVRTQQDGSVNFSYNNDEKFRINGTYSVNNNNNILERSSFRTTYLPGDSLLLQQEDNNQQAQSRRHNLSLRSRYKFSEKTTLRTGVRYSNNRQSSERYGDDITYNGETTEQVNFERISDNTSERGGNNLAVNNTLMQKFNKKGRRLLINVNLSYAGTRSIGENDNINNYYFPVQTNRVLNLTQDDNNSYSGQASLYYTEPIGEYHSIRARYNYNHQYSDKDRDVAVNSDGEYQLDTSQSRGFENTNINHTIGLAYQYNKDKFTAGLGFDAEPYSRRSLPTDNNGVSVEQRGANYFPMVYLRYKLSKASNISFNYNGSITPPSLSQLQPIPDYTDSLNIFIGNPQLTPELDNNIRVRLSSYQLKSGRNMWLTASVGWVNNKIINKTELTGSKRTTTPVNADGNYKLNSSFSYTEPLVKKKLRATLSMSASMANNVTIVNGVQRDIANYTLSPRFRLTAYTDKWYEGGLNYSYRWNKVAGQQSNMSTLQSDNTLQTHDLTHDGTFMLPYGFRASYYLSYMINNGLTQSFQQEFFLVNLMLDKNFEKPRGLSLRLHAFDIFNNYPTVQRSVTDNYFEDLAVNRIGSYLMFSVVYKFTSFPVQKGEGSIEEE